MSPILRKFLLDPKLKFPNPTTHMAGGAPNLQQSTPVHRIMCSNWFNNWNFELCMPLFLKVVWRIACVNNSLKGSFQFIRPVFYLPLCCGII